MINGDTKGEIEALKLSNEFKRRLTEVSEFEAENKILMIHETYL